MRPLHTIPGHTIRQVVLMLLIAGLMGILLWNLRFFIPALLGAYAFYVLLRDPLFYLTEKRNWSPVASAIALLVVSIALVVVPLNWMIGMLQGKFTEIFQRSDEIKQQITITMQAIESKYGIALLTTDNMQSLGEWSAGQAQSLLGATVNGVLLLVTTYFLLWFMLAEGRSMERTFFDWLPLRHENIAYVRKRLNEMVWGNALGIPLMGLVQGSVALLAYWFAGVDDPWMWFAVTFVAGMMPIAGVALAYVPLTLILLSQGKEWQAALVFGYGVVVVGSVDNIARMWLMRKISRTHPLITLFGVVAGLQLFGFIGFVFGPILIELFILLLRLYHKEFGQETS